VFVQGITIVEGDCIADIAVNSTVKLLHLLGYSHIPVALSTLKAANPFPDRYR
jgi:purine nucleosidase